MLKAPVNLIEGVDKILSTLSKKYDVAVKKLFPNMLLYLVKS